METRDFLGSTTVKIVVENPDSTKTITTHNKLFGMPTSSDYFGYTSNALCFGEEIDPPINLEEYYKTQYNAISLSVLNRNVRINSPTTDHRDNITFTYYSNISENVIRIKHFSDGYGWITVDETIELQPGGRLKLVWYRDAKVPFTLYALYNVNDRVSASVSYSETEDYLIKEYSFNLNITSSQEVVFTDDEYIKKASRIFKKIKIMDPGTKSFKYRVLFERMKR